MSDHRWAQTDHGWQCLGCGVLGGERERPVVCVENEDCMGEAMSDPTPPSLPELAKEAMDQMIAELKRHGCTKAEAVTLIREEALMQLLELMRKEKP